MIRVAKKHVEYWPVSPTDFGQYFFGYYNLCPWSTDAKKILCHRASFLDRMPAPLEKVQIGTICPESKEFTGLAESSAWNWQQGSNLQWLNKTNYWGENSVLYNDYRYGRAIAVIMPELNIQKEKIIDYPIYACAPDGESGLSLNYSRLNKCRPEYGYTSYEKNFPCEDLPTDDGISLIDFKKNSSKLLFSLRDIATFEANRIESPETHYINHIVINPSGSRFLFLHRYVHHGNITQSRLLTADINGSNLRLLMDGFVSHFDWLDSNTIIAWAGFRKSLAPNQKSSTSIKGRIRSYLISKLKSVYYFFGKPRFLTVYFLGDSYHIISDSDNSEASEFAKGVFLTDGHCTVNQATTNSNRWMLTDGYPNLQNRQPLYLYNFQTKKAYEIGCYPTPRELDGDIRVDLHPRFNRDATKVCFDSAMDGTRRVYVADISKITSE